MQKKEEAVWQHLLVQLKEVSPMIQPSEISTSGFTEQQVGTLNIAGDVGQEVSSPTFHKINSFQLQIASKNNENFSFYGHLFESIQNMEEKESTSQKNLMKQYFQSYDSFCSTQHQKQHQKNNLNSIFLLTDQWITNLKFVINSIKIYINKSIQNYLTDQNNLFKLLHSSINQLSQKHHQQKLQLTTKIQNLLQMNYISQQKCQFLQKKSQSLQLKISQLVNQINQQKICNKNINKKYMELHLLLQNKNKDYFQLLSINSSLQSQIDKINKNYCQNQLSTKYYYNQNIETPQRITEQLTNKHSCIVSSKTNTTNNTLPLSIDSVTFYPPKMHLSSRKHINHTFNTTKQNEKDNWRSVQLINQSQHLSKTTTVINQTKVWKMSNGLSSPLNILQNSCDQQKIDHNNSNKLLARIKKLNDDIKSEITDLKKETQ